mmetsp:Transcript_118682/g.378363  ORF Transcript_118682/g.378363 Transcript_118682/m.378363 type:complete len:221 (+) Transcript_118682:750-1412(+)
MTALGIDKRGTIRPSLQFGRPARQTSGRPTSASMQPPTESHALAARTRIGRATRSRRAGCLHRVGLLHPTPGAPTAPRKSPRTRFATSPTTVHPLRQLLCRRRPQGGRCKRRSGWRPKHLPCKGASANPLASQTTCGPCTSKLPRATALPFHGRRRRPLDAASNDWLASAIGPPAAPRLLESDETDRATAPRCSRPVGRSVWRGISKLACENRSNLHLLL